MAIPGLSIGLKRPHPAGQPLNAPPAKRSRTDAGPVAVHPHGVQFGAQAANAEKANPDTLEKQDGAAEPDDAKSRWSIDRIADRIVDFIDWVQKSLETLSQKFGEFLERMSERFSGKEKAEK